MSFPILPAQTAERDKVYHAKIYFHRNQSDIQREYQHNDSSLVNLLNFIDNIKDDSLRTLTELDIEGMASPEGNIKINTRLAEERAKKLKETIFNSFKLTASVKTSSSVSQWESMFQLLDSIGYRYTDDIKAIVYADDIKAIDDATKSAIILKRLKAVRGGEVWNYLDNELLPELRATIVTLIFRERESLLTFKTLNAAAAVIPYSSPKDDYINYIDVPRKRHFITHLAVSNNMLYDIALVPNIGVEYDLGRHWSLGGNWMYAWWKTDKRHDYWRIYGGDAHLQRWFATHGKLFAGHHIGLYGQIVTYDFELGKRGYLGDKWSYGAGLVYGYSWPIKRRLRIDTSLYLGYLGGEYKEYLPIDTHYVWQVTKQRHYYGPTQAQVSIVWLLDKEPAWRKQKKGGRQ